MAEIIRISNIENYTQEIINGDLILTPKEIYITEEELKIKLLSTMAVWKATKGVYIITKMKKNIYITFDNTKWEDILCKIKLWSESAF